VGGTLVVQQAEGLAVTTDINLPMSWVDLGTGEIANFHSIMGLVSARYRNEHAFLIK